MKDKSVNQLILESIRADAEDQGVKSFLINVLTLEQKHMPEERWRYGEDYEYQLKRALTALKKTGAP